MATFATEKLGFGMPDLRSPARGSGVRFGRARVARYIAPRKRLVRMRGLGEGDDYYPYTQEYGEYPAPASQQYAPTSAGSTGSVWSVTGSSSGVAVAAVGGGSTTVSSSWLRDIGDLFKTGYQAYAQQRIIDLNVERAKQGLPLVDPRNFSPSAAVNFGLTPQAAQMLLIGGGALVLLMMLRKKK